MAKRFGRNQKRKMRAEINNLKMNNKILSYSNEKLRDSLDYITSVIQRICPHSVCLKPQVISGSTTENTIYDQVCEPIDTLLYEEKYPTPADFCYRKEKLYKIEIAIENNKQIFQHCIHLKVRGQSCIKYFLSETYFNQLGIPKRELTELISNEFERFFADRKA